jgi:hypothetical protein
VTYHDQNRVEILKKDGARIVASRRGTQLLKGRMR